MGLDATGKLGNIFAAINDVRTVYDAYSSGNMSALDAATGIISVANDIFSVAGDYIPIASAANLATNEAAIAGAIASLTNAIANGSANDVFQNTAGLVGAIGGFAANLGTLTDNPVLAGAGVAMVLYAQFLKELNNAAQNWDFPSFSDFLRGGNLNWNDLFPGSDLSVPRNQRITNGFQGARTCRTKGVRDICFLN